MLLRSIAHVWRARRYGDTWPRRSRRAVWVERDAIGGRRPAVRRQTVIGRD